MVNPLHKGFRPVHRSIVKQSIASLVNLCTQLIEALDNHRGIYTPFDHVRIQVSLARHRLRHGMPDGVLTDLAEALDVEGLLATARDTLTTAYAYLERHREHINDEAYKALG